MATSDSAEVCIVLSAVENAGAGRQGREGPGQSGRKSTLWFGGASGMVGCYLRGPVDWGEVPIGLRNRTNVADFEGSMPYFAMDIRFHQEAGEKQSGR